MCQHTMEKKIYQQPQMQHSTPWVELPIAQLPVGSNEHDDQWTKERGEDFDPEEDIEDVKYGDLW